MATPHLKIDPDDCSGIGLLVLEYIEKHQLTFTEMSERIGISRSALRLVCLKQGNPGKRTVPKLARVLNCAENKLCRMICENKLRQMYENDKRLSNLRRAAQGWMLEVDTIIQEPRSLSKC